MTEQELTIKRWSAWMPGVSTREDWQAWAAGQKHPEAEGTPSLAAVPPLLRRRLSPLGKMAVAVAWSLVPPEQSIPSVFCSRHGELQRTVEMLTNLANGEPLSPTHFSLSVHNAIGGVYSIARRDTSPITALAAGDDGLNLGLLESALILTEADSDEVLCLIYDAPMPVDYQAVAAGVGPRHPYALALVVGPSAQQPAPESQPLQLTRLADAAESAGEPQALQFIRFLLDSEQQQLSLTGQQHAWQWTKAAGRGC